MVVMGDSLLRGTVTAARRADKSCEVCCLLGDQIQDITDKLTRLFSPADDYPFLMMYVGTSDTARRDPEEICKDYENQGRTVKTSILDFRRVVDFDALKRKVRMFQWLNSLKERNVQGGKTRYCRLRTKQF